MMKSSFFDTEKLSNIWEKIEKNNEKEINSMVYLEGEFFIEKKSELKKKYFYFTEDFIFKSNSNEQIFANKYMTFENLRVEFFEGNKSAINGIRFMKNDKIYEMFGTDSANTENCKEFIRTKCILNTFHLDFEVKKMIGKGNFAKVYHALRKSNNKNYAIKAFSKEYLLSQKNGKVIKPLIFKKCIFYF